MTPEELHELRARHGWSREWVANQLDVSYTTITRYELNTQTIPRVVELALRYIADHGGDGAVPQKRPVPVGKRKSALRRRAQKTSRKGGGKKSSRRSSRPRL